jgi:hypothetical protein
MPSIGASIIDANFRLIRTALKIKITRRRQNGAEHLAPVHLNSTAVAWVWNPACPCFQAVNRDQTLGLRSVVPLASSFCFQCRPKFVTAKPMPRCEARLLLPDQYYLVSGLCANGLNPSANHFAHLQLTQSISHPRSGQARFCGESVEKRGYPALTRNHFTPNERFNLQRPAHYAPNSSTVMYCASSSGR